MIRILEIFGISRVKLENWSHVADMDFLGHKNGYSCDTNLVLCQYWSFPFFLARKSWALKKKCVVFTLPQKQFVGVKRNQ